MLPLPLVSFDDCVVFTVCVCLRYACGVRVFVYVCGVRVIVFCLWCARDCVLLVPPPLCVHVRVCALTHSPPLCVCTHFVCDLTDAPPPLCARARVCVCVCIGTSHASSSVPRPPWE